MYLGNILRANAFCVLIKSAQKHARKRTHVRNCVCVFACKQTQIQVYAHIYERAYARSIVYIHTQFALTNGLTTRKHVYIIKQVMPCPNLTYIHTCARTHAHTRTQSIANSIRKWMQTHARKRTQICTQTHRCDRCMDDFCVQKRFVFAR